MRSYPGLHHIYLELSRLYIRVLYMCTHNSSARFFSPLLLGVRALHRSTRSPKDRFIYKSSRAQLVHTHCRNADIAAARCVVPYNTRIFI